MVNGSTEFLNDLIMFQIEHVSVTQSLNPL